MKKLFISIAAIAFCLSACDKNGLDDGTVATDGVIDYIEFLRYDEGEEAGAHSKIVYTPTFDNQGRLVKALEQWYFADHETGELAANQYYQTTISYDDAKHTAHYERGNGHWSYDEKNPGWTGVEVSESETVSLNDNGHITSFREGKDTFTYKGEYLDVYDSDPTNDYWWNNTTYIWEDGDLQKMHRKNHREEGDIYVFTYTKDLNPFGNYDIFSTATGEWIDGDTPLWAAGLFGKHSKHLVATEKAGDVDDPTVITYTYKKDSKGRISEVRRAEGEAVGGPVGGVFKIYWK